MQRKIPMLLGKAYERHQRRTIGLTVLAALMVPLTAGTMLMLMPSARAVDNWDVEGANGTLHVYGALTESACSLEMTSARQEVWLGETGTAHFQRPGDRGTPVAFELTLKDCLRAPASNRDAWTGVLAWSGSQPACPWRLPRLRMTTRRVWSGWPASPAWGCSWRMPAACRCASARVTNRSC